jgi:peptidoglycan hydrolase-like protein with peptidoglycan-binding domain
MRTSLQRATVFGSILAVLAAGMFSLSAYSAQSTAQNKSAKGSDANHFSTNIHNSSNKSHDTSSKSSGKTGSKTSGKNSSRKGSKVKGQAAPTPERINEIQSALAKNGAYDGVPSGKWDDSTVDAMKKFQSAHGLNPSGKLDAPTLQKLGLGSETAGLAAPTPPPNGTTNRLLSSRSQQDHPENQPDNPDN